MDKVKVGYEVGTGKEVEVPINHTCITGQTQVAGKTTALEAMVSRSGMPAIAFVTKRFESGFKGGNKLKPYFRERADWQFVASILEATLRERMKFQRSWIMKLCTASPHWPSPKTLSDVLANVNVALEKAKGINESVYTELKNYLEIVVPQIERLPFRSGPPTLAKGLNVMNLADYSGGHGYTPEMQGLIIQSVLTWVYHNESNVVTVIPEAWEFIPQKRNSPVKIAAVELIRKGAAGKNFVWLDSQDIAGVDKELLRSCVVWLLGVQREKNEVKRTLAQIPFGSPKPTVEDIMGLGLGQFFVCHGRTMTKVYVQPTWASDKAARDCAMGEANITLTKVRWMLESEDEMWKEKYEKIAKEQDELQRKFRDLQGQYARLQDIVKNWELRSFDPKKKISGLTPGGTCRDLDNEREVKKRMTPTTHTASATPVPGEEDIYERIVKRLQEDPKLLALTISKPEIDLKIERPKISLDDTTCRGRIANLLAEGFFETSKKGYAVWQELTQRRRYKIAKPNIYRECDALSEMGFLTLEPDGYKAVPDMKVTKFEA